MTRPVKRGTFRRSCRTCPWTGEYDTKAMADFGKRRHSCERWNEKAAKAERGRVRMESIDRTPKPCLHPQANDGKGHEHGQYATYTWDKCRCIPCKNAATAYEQDRVRQQAYGRWDNLIDAEPVRAHLAALKEYGIGLKRVSALTGVSNGSLTKIWYGVYAKAGGPSKGCKGAGVLLREPCRRVKPETAAKILALELVPANLGAGVVDHERTDLARIHLRSLTALGWSGNKLADRLGVGRANFTPLLGDRPISRSMVDRIEGLYAELCMTPPSAASSGELRGITMARRQAKQRGWKVPLELDDLGIELTEDPAEDLPAYDEAAVFRRVNGDRSVSINREDRLEVIRRLHKQGLQDGVIQAVTGIHRDQVCRDRKDLGLAANPNPEHSGLSDHFTGRAQAKRNAERVAS